MQLIKLAKILGVRTEYFFRPETLKIEGIEYRTKSTLPQKSLDKIQADIFDQAERSHELLSLYPQPPIQPFALPDSFPERICDAEQIEALAEAVRADWNLGLNCIPDMIKHLVITIQALRIAYQSMKRKARRLPWDLAEKHLYEFEAGLGLFLPSGSAISKPYYKLPASSARLFITTNNV